MKPDYRISIAVTALLIVIVLLIPPWKDQFTGQFVDFYYVFSGELPKLKWVNNSPVKIDLQIDYSKLIISILGIISIMLAIHLFASVPLVNNSTSRVFVILRKYIFLILFILAALFLYYFSETGNEENITIVFGVLVALLFLLSSGIIKLKSGIKILDSNMAEGNIDNYANLFKLLLLSLALLFGLFNL